MLDSQNQFHSATAPPWKYSLALLIAFGLCMVAITSQSFWIDEAGTATIAMQRTFAGWWQAMLRDGGSSTQMPLYMVYVWGWEKIFGHGEWWLRAANLPWIALGLLAVPRRRIFFLLAIAVSAFVWFYLDEARPYVMQISAALLMLCALWRLAEFPAEQTSTTAEKIPVWSFCLGFVALCGSSLLGVIWAGAALPAALSVLGWEKIFQLARRHAWLLLATAIFLPALAFYYLWSLKHGSRSTPGSTGAGNALFAGYELLGFAGLGPGRFEIRDQGFAAFHNFFLPLAIYAVVTASVLLAGCQRVIQRTSRRIWLGVTVALGAASGFLLIAGIVLHFRVLGRHFTPLAPVILLLIAAGLSSLWERGGWRRILTALFLLLSFASAVSLKLAERHAKDDYQSAAAVARAACARGESVWWCADGMSGNYYGVSFSKPGQPPEAGKAWLAINRPEDDLSGRPPPQWVITSKPDLYDNAGAVREYVAHGRYRVAQTPPAFTIWRREENNY
jgi:hypothetical protein